MLGIQATIIGGSEWLDTRPAVFVCNHQSLLDVVLLGYVWRPSCVVVAKRSIRFYPLLGQFMLAGENIFIDRGHSSQAKKTLDEAVEQIKKKKKIAVFVFPEGTRARLGEALLPFKKGAFHMAQQAGVPIIPVVISSYIGIYESKKRSFPGGHVYIKVLPPVETKDLTPADVGPLSERIRESMLEALHALNHREKAE